MFYKKSFSFIKICQNCGAPIWHSPYQFCRACWSGFLKVIKSSPNDPVFLEGGLVARCGFRWSPNDRPFLGRILNALKGGSSPFEWEDLALEFILSYEQDVLPPMRGQKPIYIVPKSSQFPDLVQDHSFLWASGLKKLTGGDIELALRKPIQVRSEQKRLSRQQRLNRTLQMDPEQIQSLYKRWGDRPLIFADDVVTTGGTAKAIFQTLDKPHIFKIWALAHRMSLRKR